MTDLPAGYQWATEGQENTPGAIVVKRTVDSAGNAYTQDEADIAIPIPAIVRLIEKYEHAVANTKPGGMWHEAYTEFLADLQMGHALDVLNAQPDEITAENDDEILGDCLDCRNPIYADDATGHAVPCAFCTSDGHASCQHVHAQEMEGRDPNGFPKGMTVQD